MNWYRLIQCCKSQQDYADFHQLNICPKVNEETYSKPHCMLSLNYHILDNSRANDIVWQKRWKKERKNNPNTKRLVFVVVVCFGFFWWNYTEKWRYWERFWFVNRCWSGVISINKVTLDVSQKLSSLFIVFCKPETTWV